MFPLLIFLMGIMVCLPPFMILAGSIVDNAEWKSRVLPLLNNTDGYIFWKWIPDYPTLLNYVTILFYSPKYLVLFWNSIKIVTLTLAGQLIVGIPAAWYFSMYKNKPSRLLFTIYTILMFMPFQVTLLSKYMVLENLQMMDTLWAVIIPGIFSTFTVFLIYRGFESLTREVIEAGRIDGASELQLFLRLGLPLNRNVILASLVLSFLDCWNMMEEPLAFLKTKELWPLSLYLAEIDLNQIGDACVASVIVLIISFLIFAIFGDSIETGIVKSALKG